MLDNEVESGEPTWDGGYGRLRYKPQNWTWRSELIAPAPCAVFDIDGVLADAEHRQHLIRGRGRNWHVFFEMCRKDALIEEVANMGHLLDPAMRIVLCTARPQSVAGETLEWLEEHGVRWDLLVMREHGDQGGTMYLVQKGRIEISLITDEGKKIVLNQIGLGHSFGEIAMVDKSPRTASAIAIENSTVIPITSLTFLETVQRCPQIAMNLLELMCERIRWVSDSVEEYAAHPLDLRLARRLLTLHKNFADDEGYIEITQNDLADFAGATREATNKILINWQALGLIKLARRKIFISQPEKLQHIAYPSFF